jgi:CRP/FNR family transcriptional regulator, cyclic AMP receptor protein
MATADPNMLRNIPLFNLFDDDELVALSKELDEVHFLAGQSVFSAGDDGGTMFIVQSGRVELFLQDKADDRVSLGFVEPGGLFGELSLLDNQSRSAGAKALADTDLLVIDRNDLRLLIAKHPDAALDMMATLGKRIRETNFLLRDRVTRNANEEIAPPTNFGERLSDFLTRLAGDIRFVYISFIWFVVWIVINVGLIPRLQAFDPFPFGLLTMVVSLEAIFLSLFVLISQNRQAARDKVRNDIEYEVNLKAEVEIRSLSNQVETLQQLMLQHLSRLQAFEAAIKVNNSDQTGAPKP